MHDPEDRLRQREEELARLVRITERINRGLTLEEVLEAIYRELKEVIPYNRIGFSLIDQARNVVVARWAKSDRQMLLGAGYEGELRGSTLGQIVETAQPRIINDLEAYLREKPDSESTSLVVREGVRSSLTCPLIVLGKPIGFVFFSSTEKDTYSNVHVEFFQQIVGQLATIVEKGRLYAELAQQKETIEKQNLVMTHQLEMARQVQQSLIPTSSPDIHGLEVALAYEPAAQVGGDVLDIIPLGDGRVVFFVGDAMGHGVQAALVMSAVKAALQSAVEVNPNPAAVLENVNNALTRLLSEHFVTAACCLVDPGQQQAELSLAGHAGPLRFCAKTNNALQDDSASLPMGVAENTRYETASMELATGDALVFSTDGLVEAFDPKGNQYGYQRFREQVLRSGRASALKLCADVRSDLDTHCEDRVIQDDVTLLVVRFVGVASA